VKLSVERSRPLNYYRNSGRYPDRIPIMHKPLEALEGLFFFQRDFLCANHFAATSPEGAVLVDTGYVGSKARTLALLRSVGIEAGSVARIINTHCHCDHAGGNGAVQALSNCEILLHRADREIVDAGDGRRGWWEFLNQDIDPYRTTGALEDGDEVLIGRHPFEVVHLPGHSPGQIGLFHRDRRLLISTDALWPVDIGVVNEVTLGEDVVGHWLSSLDRIEALGAVLVFPGHGPSFTHVEKALTRTRKKLERYAAEPRVLGRDFIKRIAVYTLLMRGAQPTDGFFDTLMASNWYAEVVERYFGEAYDEVYDKMMASLVGAGALRVESGLIDLVKK
jgi:glyoxylase-like metal-dependent hydrolase (beta-lactamase superfamily II)